MKIFDLEEERVKQEIAKLGAKRVLIQLPQGLKNEGLRIAKVVEKAGAFPIVSADPCYGACDLATEDAESLGADLVIHYGHAKLLKYEKVPTVYVEARATISVNEAIKEALRLMDRWSKIGLATTVQHVQTIDEAKEMLVRAGKTVMVGDAGRLNYPGQVIGCDYSNAKSIAGDVEAFLFIGGGRFHALGLAISTSKPTMVADPYEKRAYIINDEAQKILKKRWANIQEAEKAKTFAILVGLKPGQKRFEEALSIKEKLEKIGRSAYVFAVRELIPDVIMDFLAVDAYVNTACPRIALDDASRFHKPVLTLNEARLIIGELSWEELCRKGFFGD
ncbi:MAG: diphthamide biosynthesis enzyme Dph2 [Nitrososphaerota archaeon]|nr:diphthamide biosynthesis enzyme Dph2 [Candidatus Bathyarchaeota archaeon]MDW8023816.1 diphthamide biosynthesis enzyme Dph2 [Nitrososphaerota archaeon]